MTDLLVWAAFSFVAGMALTVLLYFLFDKKVIKGRTKPSLPMLVIFLAIVFALFWTYGLVGSLCVLAWKLRYG